MKPGAGRGSRVRLAGVSKQYGRLAAVQNVSLDISPGEFFTLLGPSGSGKTTLLTLVAGFTGPSTGDIFFDDRPVTEAPPYVRGVGMVFQNYALFPHRTVFDNVAFPLRIRRVPAERARQQVREALRLVQLETYGDRYPRQLSGGQQQRVALARAIVYEPPILLMDEPLGALDRKLRDEMQLEIRRLHALLGCTVIYVTHDQAEALTLSDRLAILRGGRIEQIGAPLDVYNRPATPFVADFIGESNFLAGRVVEQQGESAIVELAGRQRLRVPGRAGLSAGQSVTLSVRPEQVRLSDREPGENVLEARVQGVIFLGDVTKYLLAAEPELRLIVKEGSRDREKPLAPGEAVRVTWKAEDCLCFPDPETSDA